MDVSWDDLRLFLDVARLGGLSAARATTGLSAATLGRRVTALERQIGETLFVRAQRGFTLTSAGEALLKRAEDVEAAMRAVTHWRDGAIGARVVRVSAGGWTTDFLSRHIEELWSPDDGFRVEFVTAYDKVDIGRRAADIGIRNSAPTEQSLAGRKLTPVAYALYCAPRLVAGVRDGLFVGVSGPAAATGSARWLQAHHGDRIVVSGNDAHSVRELVAAGTGITVLPCFIGDVDPRLSRIRGPIPDLASHQWLILHHEERHSPPVRTLANRIARLMRGHANLFAGDIS
ncbi:MAG: LysR family transcriptional regulator [Pelagibacterium sp.]|nr:LysR family transcriptional regulator [Pelagibacterium sp.]|tara:strand:+ start:4957 stop:5820 length:864 start_codon:yes stop_codon:yes gene_type:complete